MFLRVGNVQGTRQVLDAFFFWMLPFLKDRSAILTDTWSISSIALNASRLLERYWMNSGPEQINRFTSEECYVDMLSSYPDDLLWPLVKPASRLCMRLNQRWIIEPLK
jgi:hypothetical protein